MLRSHQGEQTDHPLQRKTYNHSTQNIIISFGGGGFFLILGRPFGLKFFLKKNFCFVVESLLFLFNIRSFIHTVFLCLGGSVSVGRCAFLFLSKYKQLNNFFGRIGWPLCRLICSFGLSLLETVLQPGLSFCALLSFIS